MILITGATGQLGAKIIEKLLNSISAEQIVAFVRDENKAQGLKAKGVSIRLGEYDDQAALAKAMQGIDKVLLISGGRADNGLQQHQNVIDAAQNAGVRLIAYTSRCLKDRSSLANELMKRHFETEDYILNSGMAYIFFRNSLYLEAMAIFMGKNVLETGILLPAGDGRASYALRDDQAEAIANTLAIEDYGSRSYDFTNSQTYSFYDVAEALSELSNQKIVYTSVDVIHYKKRAVSIGMPEFAADAVASFMTDVKNGQESTVSKDMETVLGRKPLGLKAGLKILYNL